VSFRSAIASRPYYQRPIIGREERRGRGLHLVLLLLASLGIDPHRKAAAEFIIKTISKVIFLFG
jgi:hypothetical protein